MSVFVLQAMAISEAEGDEVAMETCQQQANPSSSGIHERTPPPPPSPSLRDPQPIFSPPWMVWGQELPA